MNLGRRIKRTREAQGLTQAELAELAGLGSGGQQVVHALENRDSKRSQYALALCRALNLSPEWALEGTGPKHPTEIREASQAYIAQVQAPAVVEVASRSGKAGKSGKSAVPAKALKKTRKNARQLAAPAATSAAPLDVAVLTQAVEIVAHAAAVVRARPTPDVFAHKVADTYLHLQAGTWTRESPLALLRGLTPEA